MALPKLEALINFTTSHAFTLFENGISLGTCTIAAGSNYYANTGGQLLAALETELENVGAGNYTVTLDDDADSSTGKVTIAVSGVSNYGITWVSTTLRDALGFTANISSVTTSTASKSMPSVWLPTVGRTNPRGPDPSSSSSKFGQPEITYLYAESRSGATRVAIAGSERRKEPLEFVMVKGKRARTELEQVTNESFESWLRNNLMQSGAKFAYFPDRGSDGVYVYLRATNASVIPIVPTFSNWVGDNTNYGAVYNIGPFEVIHQSS